MKNSCPQWDSKPVPTVYEANLLSIALLDLISIDHLKVDHVFPECAIKIYLDNMVDVDLKCLVMYYILFTLYSQQMS